MSEICAATRWPTNAAMIAEAVVPLGYIKPDNWVIDLTFGRGAWWADYRHPGPFLACLEGDREGADPMIGHPDHYNVCRVPDYRDARNLTDNGYDVVAFDPPYVSMGGRSTSGLPDFMDRYGLENAATTPELLQKDNEAGLRTAHRICAPGGLVLAKCAPYISSGVRKDGDWWARDAGLKMGFKVHDMLIHLGDVRAQPSYATCRKCKGTGRIMVEESKTYTTPPGVIHIDDPVFETCPKCHGNPRTERVPRHARNNYSVCFVFRKPKPRRKK